MSMPRRDDQEDDFFDTVSAMADRLKMKGSRRAKYIDDHMREAGYRRVQTRDSYQLADDDDDDGDTGFFGRRKNPSGSRRNRDDDSDEY
jgi:hypothetical protein